MASPDNVVPIGARPPQTIVGRLADGYANLMSRLGVPGFDRNTAGRYFTMPLSQAEIEAAYRLLLNERCPGWLYQVARGATTMWERWDAVREDGSRRWVLQTTAEALSAAPAFIWSESEAVTGEPALTPGRPPTRSVR